MEHTYKITGMHCASCVGKIKKALTAINGIENAEVTLDPPQAIIKMNQHIPDTILNKAVKSTGNYLLIEDSGEVELNTIAASSNSNPKLGTSEEVSESSLKTYFPLLLVFVFIIILTIISGYNSKDYSLMHLMSTFMGGFFITFSFFKLLDVKNFAFSFSTYDVIAKKFLGYGYVYPFIELLLGIAFLTGFKPIITNTATIIVMGLGTIGVIQSLLEKRKIKCACLGAVFNLPMSSITLFEDLLMIAMAIIALVI
ncbi:hypothetical protein BH10BAC5_BH10BAC5_02260 [soil metagenome]